MDYFNELDVKSNVTKFLLPEHGGPCGNQTIDQNNSIYLHKDNNATSENSLAADDLFYNETVMRGAFAKFLRRLADQVENGLISLFDAISLSPCQSPMPSPTTLQTNTSFNNVISNNSPNNNNNKNNTPLNNNNNNNNNSINLTNLDSSPSPSPPHLNSFHQSHDANKPTRLSPPELNESQILGEESLSEIGQHQEQRHPHLHPLVPHFSGSHLTDVSSDPNEQRQISQIINEDGNTSTQLFLSEIEQDQNFDIKVVPLLSSHLNPCQDPYPDVLVDNIKLQTLLQRIEAIDSPNSSEEMHRLSLSILREVINMTFSKIELANASGLGLRRTKAHTGCPLDRRKVEAIKLFYTNLSLRRQWPKISRSTFHKAFTIKISNAKRDLRRL